MPKTSAWVCDRTGKLFLSRDDYRGHLRELARKNNAARRLARQRAAFDCEVDKFRFTVRSIADIERWLLANLEMIADCRGDRVYRRQKEPMGVSSIKLHVSYNTNCSYTHSAPKGRKTNWGREKGIPHGYPGFSGHVNIVTENWFDSRFLEMVGVHTGTGGGGGKSYGYGVVIWAEDFPKLRQW
jgi:hypothetical protein